MKGNIEIFKRNFDVVETKPSLSKVCSQHNLCIIRKYIFLKLQIAGEVDLVSWNIFINEVIWGDYSEREVCTLKTSFCL